jgi:hypothetical protein
MPSWPIPQALADTALGALRYWNGSQWSDHPIPAYGSGVNTFAGSLAYGYGHGIWLGSYVRWTGSRFLTIRSRIRWCRASRHAVNAAGQPDVAAAESHGREARGTGGIEPLPAAVNEVQREVRGGGVTLCRSVAWPPGSSSTTRHRADAAADVVVVANAVPVPALSARPAAAALAMTAVSRMPTASSDEST